MPVWDAIKDAVSCYIMLVEEVIESCNSSLRLVEKNIFFSILCIKVI